MSGEALPGAGEPGKLTLSRPGLPPLDCVLLDLADGSCRGSASFAALEPAAAVRWKELLRPGLSVRITLEHIPNLGLFEIDGMIAVSRELASQIELELHFHQTAGQKFPMPRFAGPPPKPGEESRPAPVLRYKPLGEVLVHMRQLKPPQIEPAVKAATARGEKLGRYLIRSGVISSDVLCRALALQSGLPMTELAAADIPEDLGQLFGWELMAGHSFLPFDKSESFVCVAAAGPLKPSVILELEQRCGLRLEVYLCHEDVISRLLERFRDRHRDSHPSIRYVLKVPVRYQFCSRLGQPAESTVYEGATVNLSESKLEVEGSPARLDTPDNLRRRGLCLDVTLLPGPASIRSLCQIRTIRPVGAGAEERWLFSLDVVDASDVDRRRLKELRIRTIMQRKNP